MCVPFWPNKHNYSVIVTIENLGPGWSNQINSYNGLPKKPLHILIPAKFASENTSSSPVQFSPGIRHYLPVFNNIAKFITDTYTSFMVLSFFSAHAIRHMCKHVGMQNCGGPCMGVSILKVESNWKVSAIYKGTFSIFEAEYFHTYQQSEPPSLDLLL